MSFQENAELENLKERLRECEKTVAALEEKLDARSKEVNVDDMLRLSEHKLLAIGQLAAGIAHEINTPLQYVSDNTVFLHTAFEKLVDLISTISHLADAMPGGDAVIALLRKSKFDYLREEIPSALEQTLDGLHRVSTIVGAMKDFSHSSGGEKKPVNLVDAIHATVEVARNEWKYVADVDISFPKEFPEVWCMRDEFNQVVLNLVVNSAHAIADKNKDGSVKGKITIVGRTLDDGVQIEISDDGNGMPDDVQRRVFEPFFTTKPVGKGTGQGLMIARAVVVDKHQGRLNFKSRAGEGTTFEIWLPLEANRPVTENAQ